MSTDSVTMSPSKRGRDKCASNQHFFLSSEGGTRTRDTTIMSRVLHPEPQDSNPVLEIPEIAVPDDQIGPSPITEI